LASQGRRRTQKADETDTRAVGPPIAATGTSVTDPLASRAHDQNSMLGLSTTDLAGLTVDELSGSKTAITMMLHYYRQLTDENTSLRTEVSSLRTYQQGFQTGRDRAKIAAMLLSLSNIGIGFGTSLLVSGPNWPGIATLVPGLAVLVGGLYFLVRER
jgi:hypothetical protein